MAKKRICCICQKEYEYCPTCGNDKDKPAWMSYACGDECHNLYQLAASYRGGNISVEDAKIKLAGMNTSDYDKYPEFIKKMIDDVKASTKDLKKNEIKKDVKMTISEVIKPVEVVESEEKVDKEIAENTVEEVAEEIEGKEVTESIFAAISKQNKRIKK